MHEELVGPVPFTGWVNYQLFAKINPTAQYVDYRAKMKLKNFPSKYETILADITPGNTDLLQKIASSLGNKWLCNHPAVKNHLEGLAADTQLEATRISCSTASYTH